MRARLSAWVASGRWMPYAWLVYSLPFAASALDRRRSAGEVAAIVAAYLAFLAVYLRARRFAGTRALWVVAFYDGIALAFGARNPAVMAFWIYGAAQLQWARPTPLAVAALAVQVVVAGVATSWFGTPAWHWIATMAITALVGGVCIQSAVNEARNAALRQARDEVERLAKMAERERIARDLHDLLGHTLSLVVLKSELAQKLLARDGTAAARELADIEQIARVGLRDVRAAVTGYRSAGLAGELTHVRDALAAAGIVTTVDAGEVALAPAQESALSLALREAVTNVIRHAGATECRIRLYAKDASVLLEVADNGRGGEAPFGHGLTGMRERVQALGGMLRRDTGGGTRVLVELPRAARAAS